MEQLIQITNVSRGKDVADFIIKNANLVNVVTKKIEKVNVSISNGIIARVALAENDNTLYSAKRVIDGEGKYLIPGLIDAHSHIEMSFLSPASFAQVVLKHGTTSSMLDMHDVCNVSVECMAEFAKSVATTPLKAFLTIPPCVPGTPLLEEAGCDMTLETLKASLDLPNAHLLGETMDFFRVLNNEPEMMKMLAWARKNGYRVDGHCPTLRGDDLNAYASTGILSDHESSNIEEMLEKYRLGMKVIIRRGSIEEPVKANELINQLDDTTNVLLATDGCFSLKDMIDKGHMIQALREVIAEGVDPITAIQMASINVARAYGIEHKVGSISPGRIADMILVDNLSDLSICNVFANGQEIPQDDSFTLPKYSFPDFVYRTVKMRDLCPDDFIIKAPINEGTAKVRVIHAKDNDVTTYELIKKIKVVDGKAQVNTDEDIIKVAVIDRYRENGKMAVGYTHGFGIKKGAFAGTIGQDSENMVVVGVDNTDMSIAVNKIKEIQGGIVFVVDGEIKSIVELPIAGIMSEKTPSELKANFEMLNKELKKHGCIMNDPSFALSLMLTCAAIPELKITNRGLVDANRGEFTTLFV